jgi:germination protein M
MKKFLVLILALILTLSLSGCTSAPWQKNTADQDPAVDPKPNQETVKINLYFGDRQAMYLTKEERTVTKSASLPELMINELIKGPQNQDSVATIPRETKLLSLEISGGVAYVNFSKEVKTNHWGGSAGETMTIFSVVNTLTQLPEIKKVQFLLEGEKQEAIWGHYYTLEPVEPDLNLLPSASSQSEQPEPPTEAEESNPKDYFPLTQGSTWQYLGEGNEYASFTREVLYAEGNKSQIKEDNGGTVSTSIYQITADAVTRIYFTGEDYEPKNILNQPGNENIVILKGPLKPGTKWTAGTYTREIV